MQMSKVRSFDDGKLVVTFHDEKAARDFDEYLASTFYIKYRGEVVGTVKVRDSFDPYKFFNVEREEREE